MPAVRLPCAPFGVIQITVPATGIFFFLAHQIEQHKNFVAETIRAVGRNKESAIDDVRHVRKVQRALVFDG